MPKGCSFSTARGWSHTGHRVNALGQKAGPGGDSWYICMPLYHGTGGMSAIMCMMGGIGLAIGKKFSTSGFWPEVRDSKATFFVYVGETARYLLAAPPHPLDKQHNVRCMYGNGLRPDVWYLTLFLLLYCVTSNRFRLGLRDSHDLTYLLIN